MPDHYTYPGTEVLVNRRDITDAAKLRAVETAIVGTRMGWLTQNPLPGDYDLPHLLRIHEFLFSPLYSWAGTLRDTDTGPGGTGIAHCRPDRILPQAEHIFGALKSLDHLRDRSQDQFAKDLAYIWGEVTALHAVRDGNTRGQWVFFNQLAADAGWVIDWNRIDVQVFAHARTVAIHRDEKGIDALLYPALIPVAAARWEEFREKMARVQDAFFRPRPARDRGQLDADLRAALERRARGVNSGLGTATGPTATHRPDTDPPRLGL